MMSLGQCKDYRPHIISHYGTSVICKLSVNNLQFLTASHKKFQNLNSIVHRYTITFLYVTFAAFWTGTYLVLAVDYDRYFIAKHCPLNSNEGMYVFWGILNL